MIIFILKESLYIILFNNITLNIYIYHLKLIDIKLFNKNPKYKVSPRNFRCYEKNVFCDHEFV